MKLKNTIEKFEKSLLKEQSSTVVGGHYGRGGKRGQEVDDIFAGGFDATDSVKGDLTRQITGRKKKRSDMVKAVGKDGVGTENPLGGYYDINTDALIKTYEYLTNISAIKKVYSDGLTPEIDDLYKFLDSESWENLLKTKRELVLKNREKYEKFVNDTDKEMELDLEIKYDNNESEEDKEKFINKTNHWQLVD